MSMQRDLIKTVNSLVHLNSRTKTEERRMLRKVLRSLLERFHAKITVIVESKDIDKISLIELVGNCKPMNWVLLGSRNRVEVRA